MTPWPKIGAAATQAATALKAEGEAQAQGEALTLSLFEKLSSRVARDGGSRVSPPTPAEAAGPAVETEPEPEGDAQTAATTSGPALPVPVPGIEEIEIQAGRARVAAEAAEAAQAQAEGEARLAAEARQRAEAADMAANKAARDGLAVVSAAQSALCRLSDEIAELPERVNSAIAGGLETALARMGVGQPPQAAAPPPKAGDGAEAGTPAATSPPTAPPAPPHLTPGFRIGVVPGGQKAGRGDAGWVAPPVEQRIERPLLERAVSEDVPLSEREKVWKQIASLLSEQGLATLAELSENTRKALTDDGRRVELAELWRRASLEVLFGALQPERRLPQGRELGQLVNRIAEAGREAVPKAISADGRLNLTVLVGLLRAAGERFAGDIRTASAGGRFESARLAIAEGLVNPSGGPAKPELREAAAAEAAKVSKKAVNLLSRQVDGNLSEEAWLTAITAAARAFLTRAIAQTLEVWGESPETAAAEKIRYAAELAAELLCEGNLAEEAIAERAALLRPSDSK